MAEEDLKEPVRVILQVPDFIELHELFSDELVSVNILAISEIRVRNGTSKPPWTMLRMAGSVDLEVREEYSEVLGLIQKSKDVNTDKGKV